MPPYTKGFTSFAQRSLHFQKHQADFTFGTAEEYGAAADAFMGAPLAPPVRECTVQQGDKAGRVVRYDPRTDEFGVLTPDGYVLTFYKPKPRNGTALEYFHRQCKK